MTIELAVCSVLAGVVIGGIGVLLFMGLFMDKLAKNEDRENRTRDFRQRRDELARENVVLRSQLVNLRSLIDGGDGVPKEEE